MDKKKLDLSSSIPDSLALLVALRIQWDYCLNGTPPLIWIKLYKEAIAELLLSSCMLQEKSTLDEITRLEQTETGIEQQIETDSF